MTLDGAQLDLIWAAAAGRPVVSAFRTAPIGVDTPQGAVQAGVDAEGHRHLLVPLASRHSLQEILDGDAVILRRRALEDEHRYQQYASLELIDERQTDLFTALCVEVAERVAATPERAVAALRDALKDWRALLAGNRQVLTPSALAGLFGELHLLRSMLLQDTGAAEFWTGPNGSAQDFHHGGRAVEVKTTTAPEGRSIRIHGTDQLDVEAPGRLLLHWLRVRSDQGASVPELVHDIARRTDDTAGFRKRLQEVGYHEADRDIYARKRFDVIEVRTYDVGPGFPRITPAGLTGDAALGGVGPVEYSIDLNAPAADARRVDLDPALFLLERT
ncbi:Putative PD-(D/E)XK family member [Geodermatophilus telluris]|uniref:Putative PD-(D/E)XK family member n=1 Tax=Geodermatophilus telluris TaxID=1190417 RepID=A0A1G6PCH9_9ACTN|nr:PD-(D/E)XK motif protein [Geodermatophilus telluris]SDC77952.1 Putative PD-(D/E)XK family member [Geodermatophilus telluris]